MTIGPLTIAFNWPDIRSGWFRCLRGKHYRMSYGSIGTVKVFCDRCLKRLSKPS